MGLFQGLIMGIVQGLTEFLPVSSSGHLALLNLVFTQNGGIDFTFLLHLGTFLATVVYFRHDLADMLRSLLPKNKHMVEERRLFLYLMIATAITGPIGLVLEPKLDAFASSLLVLGIAYLVTTVVLASAEYFTGMREGIEVSEMGWGRAAFIGLAQGIAVIPGISRSGATIAGGMTAGLNREKATRFSFLLALPIIAAGALMDGVDLVQGQLALPGFWVCAVGFVASAIFGYIAIAVMIDLVKRIKLYWFAAYTAVLGIILLALHFIL